MNTGNNVGGDPSDLQRQLAASTAALTSLQSSFDSMESYLNALQFQYDQAISDNNTLLAQLAAGGVAVSCFIEGGLLNTVYALARNDNGNFIGCQVTFANGLLTSFNDASNSG